MTDIIKMPLKEKFFSVEEYYSTLFHEMAHSTGHECRLNRKTLLEANSQGSGVYSKEELVAEITSAFLCAEAGIQNQVFENQAAYISNWASKLKDKPSMIIEASQKAQKAFDYITNNSNPMEAKQ